MSSPAGRAFLKICVVFACAFAVAAPGAAQTGEIGGQVRAAGAGVAGLEVHLQASGCCSPEVASTATGLDGTYVFTDVPAGTYIVRVKSDPMRDLLGEYYANVNASDPDLATAIPLAAGETRGGVDIELEPCSSVSGSIAGLPVDETVNVQVFDAYTNRWRGSVPVTGSGAYTIACVAAGRYRAYAETGGSTRAMQWYAGATRQSTATVFTVGVDEDRSGIDFTLAAGSAIAGSLSLSPVPGDPGAVFSRMWVTAIDASSHEHVASRTVNADGTFEVNNLPGGTYIIEVRTGDTNYVREVWTSAGLDTDDYNQATSITVAAGATEGGKTLALELGRQIAGHVFLDLNDDREQQVGVEPDLAGASLNAGLVSSPFGNGSGTDGDGNYVIYGLRPGVYNVHVEVGSSEIPFVPERWDGYPLLGSAYTPVDVTTADRADVHFSVLAGPQISGFVFVDADGNGTFNGSDVPVSGGTVRFSDYATGNCCAHAPIRGDGTYRMQLPAGRYRVEAFSHNSALLREYWNNTFFWSAASPVDISAGSQPDIDFSLLDGSAYGTLRGRVVSAQDGTGIPGVDVGVFQFDSDGWGVAGARTDANGDWVVAGIPPADYRVYFDTQQSNTSHDADFVGAYWSWPGTPGVIDPEDMRIVFPADASGTDVGSFSLAVGGSIAGYVNLPAGDPGALPTNTQVQAQSFESGGSWLSASVAADGSYRIRGVPAPASYRLEANAWGSDYVRVYYLSTTESTWDYNLAEAVQVDTASPVTAVNFYFQLGGSISGRVTDTVGTPLAAIPINTNHQQGGFWTNAQTDLDGRYRLRGLVDGTYTVRTDSRTGVYGNEQYPMAVTVTSPADTPDIDFVLRPAGVIRGRVTHVVGGVEVPVVNMRVQANDYLNGNFVSDARTDNNGDYAIGALARGRQYRVQIAPWDHPDPQFVNFITEYWNDRTTWDAADPVPSDPGGLQAEAPDIDFLIALGGAISGIVTDEATGLPISGLQIQAQLPATGQWVNSDTTDHNGFYIIRGLRAGSYHVRTWVGSRNYISEYYDNALGNQTATLVSVLAGTEGTPVPITPNINFELALGRIVSGTITDAATTAPVGDLQLYLNGNNVSYGTGARTAADGTYVVRGLPPGRYRLTVETSGTNFARVEHEIDLTLGDASGVDIALQPGARVSGTAYEDLDGDQWPGAGEGRAGVGVSLYDAVTGRGAGGTQTDAAGRFEISGVSPGSYRLQTETGSHNFVRLYYDNTLSQNAATPIQLNAGDALIGYDFRLQLGYEIRGLVFYDANGNGTRDPDELLLSNINVNANRDDGQYWGNARTNAAGEYVVHGLLAGQYRVNASAQGTPYASEYFQRVTGAPVGTFKRSQADLVDLDSGSATGIDFSLVLGGGVRGVVRQEGTLSALSGISVNVNAADGDGFEFGTSTDLTGAYTITGLPAGGYRVRANDPAGVYVAEYFQDALFYNLAAQVMVPAREYPDHPLATAVDFTLGQGGAIEGIVYDDRNHDGVRQSESEPGLGGVRIYVNEFASTNRGLGSATTAADGTYRVGGLPSGMSLRVQASAYPTDFITVWYDGGDDRGAWNMNAAAPLGVPAGGVTANVNFALAAGGSIAGTVRDGSGTPLGNVNVNANPLFSGAGGSGSSTDAGGVFVLHGLAAGTYRVNVSGEAEYGQEVYDNQRDNNAATPVAVTVGQTRSGLDIILPRQPLLLIGPSPSWVERGSTLTLTVTGSPLAGPQCAAVPTPPCSRVEIAGGGITILSSTLATGTGIFTLEVSVAADAPIGFRAVSVVNDFLLEDAAAVQANAFEVRPRAVGDTPATGGERLYVLDNALSQVQVYRTADHSLADTFEVCCQPNSLALSPDGNLLWITGGDRTVAAIDTRLGRDVGRIGVSGASGFNAIAATDRFVFAADRIRNDRVEILDAKTWQLAGDVILGANALPYSVRLDPLGRWLYVANSNLASVSVIDAAPPVGSLPAVLATIPLPAGTIPRGIGFTPDGTRALVVAVTNTYLVDTALAADPGTAGASVIDADGDAGNGLTPIPTRGTGNGLVTVAPWPGVPGTSLAYIPVAGNRIWVVDVSTDRPRVVRDVIAGYLPRDLRATSDGRQLFISHTGSKNYYVLETANLLLDQPQIPVELTRFASSPNPAGSLAIGPIPGAVPSTAPVVGDVTVPAGAPARNGAPITIQIDGSNFDPAPIVWLQGTLVRGIVTSATASSLTVDLPASTPAGLHPVVVTNLREEGNLSGASALPLEILPPSGYSPTQPVYVTSYGYSTLTVLSPDGSRTEMATPPYPGALAITPDGQSAFVTQVYAGPQLTGSVWPDSYYDVSIVDLAPGSETFGQVAATVPYVFGTFGNPAVVPTLDYLLGPMYVYVPNSAWADMVSVIDPGTRAEVDLDANPSTQSVEPNDPDMGQFASKLAGLNRLELDDAPTDGNMILQNVALTPDGTLLYVTGQGYPGDPYYPAAPSQVTIVDTQSHQVVGALRNGGNGLITNAVGIAISPIRLPNPDPPGGDLVFVYVAGRDALNAFRLFVYRAYDTNDATALVDSLPIPETMRGMAVSRDGRTLYLAARASGQLLAIDVTPQAGGRIAGTIRVTPTAAGILGLAVAPDDGLLYVSNLLRSEVLVYDVSSDPLQPQFVTSLGVACPNSIAAQPTLGKPRLAGISPTVGPPEGGTRVVLSGANFALGATVQFGTLAGEVFTGVPATDVVVDNAYTIHATAPAGSGIVDVKVANLDGQSDVLVGRFRYQADETPPVFTTPPYVLSQTLVGLAGLETATVTLRWRTDEPSTSVLDYGIGALTTQASDPSPITDHQIVLSGLTPGTTYLFRASSADARSNVAQSPAPPATGSWVTPSAPDVTPPAITMGPNVSVTTTSATIEWTTNEVASSLVHYDAQIDGVLTRQVSGPNGTLHVVSLASLVPNTEYEFRVLSSDASGNGPATAPAAAQPPARFRTAALPDTTPPTITSGPSVSYLSLDLVIVSWTTDEASSSFVNYGVSTIYEQAVVDLDRVTSHIVFLTNLRAGTAYGFQVGSTDASGNTVLTGDPFAQMLSTATMGTRSLRTSEDAGAVTLMAGTSLTTMMATTGFTTPTVEDRTAPTVVGPVTITVLSHDRVLVAVSTDEAASLLMRYLASGGEGSSFEPLFKTDHALVLAGLEGQTTYSLALTLTDPKGNAADVSGLSFTTLAEPDMTAPTLLDGPSVHSIAQSSAVVSWTTDESSDGVVRFALTGLPWSQASQGGLVTAHDVLLSGLQAGTEYAFEVASRDASGNEVVRAGVPFRTASLPPAIASVMPDRLIQGTTFALAVNGVRFDSNATLDAGPGITVHELTVSSNGTRLSATIEVTGGAATGPRVLAVTNPASGLAATATVAVVDATVPVVAIIEPAPGAVLTSRTVRVRGTVSEPAMVLANGVPASTSGAAPVTFDASISLAGGGEHRIVVSATDASGNRGTAFVTVTLADAEPPTLQLSVSPSELWPANHALVPVTVTVLVTDDVDPAPMVELVSVTSSEPDDVPEAGDGSTVDDIQEAAIGVDDRVILLRAERAGSGASRVYTLTYRATDWVGNQVERSVEVRVPHDRR